MKAVLALAASLSLSSASLLPRQLGNIPNCALQCALGSLQSTGCQTTDFACICQATAFITELVPCVQGSCSEAELQNTINAASGLCADAGVSLVIPPLASETGATTGPATTEPASTTEAPSSEVTSEATTAPTSEATSAPTSAETTEAPATTSSGNGTQTGTSPPTPTGTEPGAAGRNTVALGSLGAIVALVAAFL